eukprot:COSAG06_NODE_15934_length_1034_cov_1.161497_1_plen_112_part_00
MSSTIDASSAMKPRAHPALSARSPASETGVYRHPYVANPDSKWRQSWDAQMVVVLVWLGVTVPYRLSFNSPASGVYLTINLLVELALVSDIVRLFAGWPEPFFSSRRRHTR